MEHHWTAKDFENELEMLSQLLKRRLGNHVVKNMERSLRERLQGMQSCAEAMLSWAPLRRLTCQRKRAEMS